MTVWLSADLFASEEHLFISDLWLLLQPSGPQQDTVMVTYNAASRLYQQLLRLNSGSASFEGLGLCGL